MTVPMEDRIPVEPIREAFQRSGLTLSELAKEAGLTARDKGKPKADTSRAARMLGLKAQKSGDGFHYINQFMRYENALRLVRAMGLDPVDFREHGL